MKNPHEFYKSAPLRKKDILRIYMDFNGSNEIWTLIQTYLIQKTNANSWYYPSNKILKVVPLFTSEFFTISLPLW